MFPHYIPVEPIPHLAHLERLSLPSAVLGLRIASYWQTPGASLLYWCQKELGLSQREAKRWCRRAWWGIAAGELLRKRLSDRAQRRDVLEYTTMPDWSAFHETYRQHQGVILVGAHLGPPKVAMHCVAQLSMPTMIWTNKQDLPDSLVEDSGASFLDPTSSAERPTMLVRSALHLRNNGVLMGAPDIATGHKQALLERFGTPLTFSFGIPALARRLEIPVFLILALWKDYRLKLQYEPIAPPSADLGENDWYRAWIEGYWQKLEPYIRNSPENLRKGVLPGQDTTKEGWA